MSRKGDPSYKSGYLKEGTSYLPSHAPVWYSYTKNFANGGRLGNPGMTKIATVVFNKLTGGRITPARNGWQNPEVIANIQRLLLMARKSELSFLTKYGLGNPGNDWSELIRSFNRLFSTEEALHAQLNLIKQAAHTNKKDATYHYFATYFGSNLQTAIRYYVRQEVNANMPIQNFSNILDKSIELALQKTFKQKIYIDKNGDMHTSGLTNEEKANMKMIQPFRELGKVIKTFLNDPIFKDSIREALGADIDFVKDTEKMMQYNQTHKHKKLPQLKDGFRNGKIKGTVGEAFESVFSQEVAKQLNGTVGNSQLSLNWQSKWSGGSGVKADVMLYNLTFNKTITNIDLLTSQTGTENSKRVNAIEKYESWFEQMEKAQGEIVFISDKNYQINSRFASDGGFTAQNKVTLSNLGALLEKVGVGYSAELIDFLANCGPDMILGDRDKEVLDSVAAQIGHFLFDDLTIEGSHSINRIHILNLSGIYMPLSIYLEAISYAIEELAKNIETDMEELVKVDFVSRPGEEGAPSPWFDGKDDWETYRQDVVHQSYVNIHFMKNFAQFITSHVHF